jgi:hypothetical protein
LPEGIQGQRDKLLFASVVQGIAQNDRAMATDLVLKMAKEDNGGANDRMVLVADATRPFVRKAHQGRSGLDGIAAGKFYER